MGRCTPARAVSDGDELRTWVRVANDPSISQADEHAREGTWLAVTGWPGASCLLECVE